MVLDYVHDLVFAFVWVFLLFFTIYTSICCEYMNCTCTVFVVIFFVLYCSLHSCAFVFSVSLCICICRIATVTQFIHSNMPEYATVANIISSCFFLNAIQQHTFIWHKYYGRIYNTLYICAHIIRIVFLLFCLCY